MRAIAIRDESYRRDHRDLYDTLRLQLSAVVEGLVSSDIELWTTQHVIADDPTGFPGKTQFDGGVAEVKLALDKLGGVV
jgi:hypothetical protein